MVEIRAILNDEDFMTFIEIKRNLGLKHNSEVIRYIINAYKSKIGED